MPAFGILEVLAEALQPSGIRLRGVVSFAVGEGPALADGSRARSVVLVGNVGGSIWPAFSAWREQHTGDNPLDTWSKLVIAPIAVRLGATAFYPSDPPYMPFQQWAMRAEGLKASPLGILIHPDYGLWHGYRGALAFREIVEVPAETPQASPCEACVDKPCLSACPADAIQRPDLPSRHAAPILSLMRDGPAACGPVALRAMPVRLVLTIAIGRTASISHGRALFLTVQAFGQALSRPPDFAKPSRNAA